MIQPITNERFVVSLYCHDRQDSLQLAASTVLHVACHFDRARAVTRNTFIIFTAQCLPGARTLTSTAHSKLGSSSALKVNLPNCHASLRRVHRQAKPRAAALLDSYFRETNTRQTFPNYRWVRVGNTKTYKLAAHRTGGSRVQAIGDHRLPVLQNQPCVSKLQQWQD